MQIFNNYDWLKPIALNYVDQNSDIYKLDNQQTFQQQDNKRKGTKISRYVKNKIKRSQGLCFCILTDFHNAQIIDVVNVVVKGKLSTKYYLDFSGTANKHLVRSKYAVTFVGDDLPAEIIQYKMSNGNRYLPSMLSITFSKQLTISFFLDRKRDADKKYLMFTFPCTDIVVEPC